MVVKAKSHKLIKKGKISDSEKAINFKRLDNARGVLNQYIQYYEQKIKTIQGSGLRRKQKRQQCDIFPRSQRTSKKLELIIGELISGNSSIKMRNTGVAILDTLLRTSTINNAQHETLYKKNFKP